MTNIQATTRTSTLLKKSYELACTTMAMMLMAQVALAQSSVVLKMNNDDNSMSLQAGGSEQVIIQTDGSMGVNLDGNKPNATLDVSGTVSATAFVGDGSGLTGVTATMGLNDLTDAKHDTDDYSSLFLGNGSGAVNNGADNRNIGVGANSLALVTSGVRNIAIGYGALDSNTTGSNNIGIGMGAFNGLQTASKNIAIGDTPALGFETGESNTFIGNNVARKIMDGSYNTILGAQAGVGAASSTVSNTIAIGYRSGYNLSNAENNILVGFQAGDNLTTGSNNIIIGQDVDATAATTSNSLNIGNTIYGDLSTGSVGIGTNAPAVALDVSGTLMISNGGEVCDASTEGAIRYTAAGGVMYCDATSWSAMGGGGSSDNIAAGDTSVSIVDAGTGEIRLDVDGERMVTVDAEALHISGTNTISSSGTELVLQQTGDDFGISRMTLAHRDGINGALFKTTGIYDLVDFAFEADNGKRISLRSEFRTSGSGSVRNSANNTYGEMQVLRRSGSTDYRAAFFGFGASGILSPLFGVNTTSPQEELDVNGDILADSIRLDGTGSTGVAVDVSGTVSATAFVGDGSGLTGVAGGLWTDNTNYINYEGVRLYKPGTTWDHSFGDTGVYYHADKSAYRIGRQNNGSGDEANVGQYSLGMGDAVIASGLRSFAMGYTSTASGADSFAFGNGSQATGARAIAMGNGARALNSDAIAIGSGTYASNLFSIALGRSTAATQNSAFAVGNGARASGVTSVALGMGTEAKNNYSLATNYQTIASGAQSVAMGRGSQANGITSFAFGEGVIAQGNYSYVIGLDNGISGTTVTDARTMAILGGEVGIGLTSPSVELDVSGSIQYTGNLLDASDRRLKQNIQPIEDGALERMGQVEAVSFEMKDRPGVTELGVIAQDFENIYPELVKTADDEMGTKSVNYIGMIAPMVKAMQELKAEVDELKAQNAEQARLIEELQAK
ncbi:MAG: hypothetical protein CFH43_00020 [Proteobacteria bacterium]|nr:MAG: hypothetical protein CFH43_00020 [Pseudomonadota bacterium]